MAFKYTSKFNSLFKTNYTHTSFISISNLIVSVAMCYECQLKQTYFTDLEFKYI